jgi:uncharacterized membrane protein
MNKIWLKIRQNFFAGILLLLPLYLTYVILAKVFLVIDGVFNRLATRVLVRTLGLPWHEDQVIYGLGIITLFIFILLTGYFARHYLGNRFVRWINEQLDQIPVVNSIYKTLRQIFEALFSTGREAFQRPVLIEYPRKGLFSLAFQTSNLCGPGEHAIPEDCITVFLPSTPNPTTGFVLIVPKSQVYSVNMSTEEALKWIISAGVIKKEIEPSGASAPPDPPIANESPKTASG